jgi:hypothetical protein
MRLILCFVLRPRSSVHPPAGIAERLDVRPAARTGRRGRPHRNGGSEFRLRLEGRNYHLVRRDRPRRRPRALESLLLDRPHAPVPVSFFGRGQAFILRRESLSGWTCAAYTRRRDSGNDASSMGDWVRERAYDVAHGLDGGQDCFAVPIVVVIVLRKGGRIVVVSKAGIADAQCVGGTRSRPGSGSCGLYSSARQRQ